MKLKIDYLSRHLNFIPQIAEMLCAEFAYVFPNHTPKHYEKLLKNRTNENRLPMTLVAFEDEILVGTCSLRGRDAELEKHFSPKLKEDYQPWIGSVLIVSQKRGKGLGSLLLKRAEEEIQNLGYCELYLYTTTKKTWYLNRGYKIIKEIFVNGFPATIMKKTLAKEIR